MGSIDFYAICMIITSLGVFGLRNLKLSVLAYFVQAILLVLIFFKLASEFNANTLSSWAVIAIFTKVLFVPGVMLYLLARLNVKYEDEPVGGFFVSPIIAMGFSLAVSMSVYPIFLQFSLIPAKIALIAAFCMFMMGVFGFMLRNSFLKQILSYCLFENGIHLSLALMAYNSHALVELGILTDAVFAVVIMAILALRFYKVFNSLDTSKASNLRG